MLTPTFTEITGTTIEIVKRLNKMEHEEHIILIYPNRYSFREIYSHYCKTAFENNEIVLILTYYETADCVRQTLKELDIDVEKYEYENELITIQDSLETYASYTEAFLSLLNILNKQQEKRDKNGISVIADMSVFFHFQDKEALINFESSLPSKFDFKMKKNL